MPMEKSIKKKLPIADLVVVLSATLSIGFLSASLYLFGEIFNIRYSLIGENWLVSDLMLALSAMSVGLSWFAYRRWVQYSTEAEERRRAELRLRKSEQRYRLYAENVQDMLWTIDVNFVFNFVSPSASKLIGYRSVELLNKPLQSIMTRKYFDEVKSFLNDEMDYKAAGKKDTPGSRTIQLEMIGKDGSIVWVETLCSLLYDEKKRLVGVLGVSRNIEERKKTEAALRESENRYRLLADNVNDIIWTMSANLNYTFISPSVQKVRGISVIEAMQETIEETFVGQSAKKARKAFEEALERGDTLSGALSTLELEQKGYGDRSIWTETTLSVLHDYKGTVSGLMGVTRDITERKNSQAALLESEERFRNIFHGSRDAIFITDNNARFVEVNDAACRLTGYSEDELLGMSFTQLYDKNDARVFKDSFYRIIGGESIITEGNVLRKDKTKVETEFSNQRMVIGSTIFMHTVARDITERKQAERALMHSERRFRQLVEFSPDLIFIHINGIVVYVNRAGARILGAAHPQQLIGKTVFDIGHPDTHNVARRRITDILQKQKAVPFMEQKVRRLDGKIVEMEVGSAPFTYMGRPAVQVVGRDITERKRFERKLLEYQKDLRSLASEMSLIESRERREIATELHDQIGQTLAISKMRLEALREAVDNPDYQESLDDLVELINLTIKDTRSLIFELSPPILYDFGLGAAIQWLLDRVHEREGVDTVFEQDDPPLEMQENMAVLLFRIVRELLMNITKHAQARNVSVELRQRGTGVVITVKDDGKGFNADKVISREDKHQYFGIFSIRERIDHLGGRILYNSEPGRGTRVTITVPTVTRSDSGDGV